MRDGPGLPAGDETVVDVAAREIGMSTPGTVHLFAANANRSLLELANTYYVTLTIRITASELAHPIEKRMAIGQ